MKRTPANCCICLVSIFLFCLQGIAAKAQDSVKSPLIVTISYYSVNNKLQYLIVNAKAKASGRFQPEGGIAINLYLNKDTAGKPIGFIGKVVTDEKGKAVTNIPPSLAGVWKSSVNHTFIALTDKTGSFDAASSETNIVKARITIDTAADKNIVATVSEFMGTNWTPVKGVDVKLGIKRLDGDLPINDDLSYTTDSLGHVQGEFKRIGLPGDPLGNIVLIAKVEDNDQYGNLRIERSTPWGTKFIAGEDFFHRALWASRFHSPFWLVFIAYSIILAVWGTLIYLVFLLIKIRKLGKDQK